MKLYYKDEYTNLIKGECLEAMDMLIEKGFKFDSIITDIPYGTTACNWDSIIPLEIMWDKINKLIKDNGAICLFSAQPFTSELIHSNIKNYKHYWVWDKEICGAFALAKKRPMIVLLKKFVYFQKKVELIIIQLWKMHKRKILDPLIQEVVEVKRHP